MESLLQKMSLGALPDVKVSLMGAIQDLPHDFKIVIDLYFLKGNSRKQIAVTLGWSLSKVNQKITRGITLLKQELNPDYFQKANEIIEKTSHRLLLR